MLREAVRLADAEGLEALSMRRLAQALGVEAMSLYNHVESKDDVLDGITDLVVGELALPAIGGDWRAELRRRAISAHDVLMQHRWAPMLVVARLNVGPSMLAYVNATIGCLVEAGFSYALADEAWNILDGYVHGFVLRALNFPLKAEEYAAAARGFAHMLPPERYPYMRALTDLVADGEHSGQHDFELGLDLVLDGLEALLARERAGARRRRAPKKKRT
ncbi:TetR/AcrR family transcriptional regulator C-terminal domain-containing protein [Myxococcota bacterium]|nr:TetR/AcrR family transcriptional regulator C-terminal domain-containing protein [Myxococcota bacterium]